MITFHDWEIESHEILGRQYDNLSRRLEVVGNLPDAWSWSMLIQQGDNMDIIPLQPTANGVGHTLTEDQLSRSGYYFVQLRGTKAEMTKHTNVIQVFVPQSLSGSGQWPTIPSEFTQLEKRLLELNGHPPIISESGFWRIWDFDLGEYVESGFPSSGPQGETGAPGKDSLPNVSSVSGSAVTLTMNNNVEYHCTDAVTALTIQSFTPAPDGKSSLWAMQFTAGAGITVTIPDNVTWAVAEPVFTAGVSYWLSFVPLVNGGILGVWVSNEQSNI